MVLSVRHVWHRYSDTDIAIFESNEIEKTIVLLYTCILALVDSSCDTVVLAHKA